MTDSNTTDTTTTDTTTTTTADATTTTSPRDQFIQSLPEEFRADPIFANFDDWGGVAKSYANAAKLVGMDKNQILAMPKENTPEAMAPIWDKLGRPESPDKYNIEPYKDMVKPEEIKPYLEIAHKAGLSTQQFDAVFGTYLNDAAKAAQVMQEQQEQQVGQWQAEVKKEFGAAYDDKLNFAKKAVESFGLTDVIKENPTMFEHPAIIKAFVAIGEKTSEGMVLSNGSVNHGKLAPAEAQMELAKFNSDQNNINAMLDKSHPQHEFVMKKRSDLFKFAYPE